MSERKRLWVVLRQAAKSDNPTVKSALDRLRVATEIAHGEEIAKAMIPPVEVVQRISQSAIVAAISAAKARWAATRSKAVKRRSKRKP